MYAQIAQTEKSCQLQMNYRESVTFVKWTELPIKMAMIY